MSSTTYTAPDPELGQNCTEKEINDRFGDMLMGEINRRYASHLEPITPAVVGPYEMPYCGWTIQVTARAAVPQYRAIIVGPNGETDSMRSISERGVRDDAKNEIDRRILLERAEFDRHVDNDHDGHG